MGFYVPGPVRGKADDLVKSYSARRVTKEEAATLVDSQAVIAVVKNLAFDAALFCYNQAVFEVACMPDSRPIEFLIMDRELTKKLCRCPEFI